MSFFRENEFVEMGFDGIEVSCGIGEDGGSTLRGDLPFTQGFNRESAKIIKSKVKVPIYVVGGMTDPAYMEETIENEEADYISLCRALIIDPKFPNKMKEGNRNPSRCIHCNVCLFYLATRSVRCYRGKRMKSNES